MTKSRIFSALVMLFISVSAYGQDFRKQFEDLMDKKDTTGQVKLLKQWEKKSPNDAELHIAWFNHYMEKAMVKVDAAEKAKTEPPAPDAEYVRKALNHINKGIAAYPDRLDMRFGKIYILGLNDQFNEFTDEIVKTIEYRFINKNTWVEADNKPVADPDKFIQNASQDNINMLFDMGEKQSANIRAIAETILKYYPQNVEALTNLAATYMMNKDLAKGLEYLQKAEKLAPKDCSVLLNMAFAYEDTRNNNKAITYFEKVTQYGNEEEKKVAQDELKKLRKK